MKIIIHYPHLAESQTALEHKTALIHAQIIMDYIKGLDCPKKQKDILINEMISDSRKKR